ncbi:hypothetical protein AYO37_00430 [Opitutia bacterium SCGC AG-212-L18]|nr:hypothetical protein AYO37_00430 [Opitutae bacterium SCGC AG-212-L18]
MSIVAKFGGSSVRNAEAMNALAGIIADDPGNKRLVVVSAISGMTNALVSHCHSKAMDDKMRTEIIEKHITIAMDLGQTRLEAEDYLRPLISEFNALAARELQEAALQEEWLSLGERFSSMLVVLALRKANLEAICFDVRRVLITNDHFGKAVPDFNETKSRVSSELMPLLKDEIVVTQGFIGATIEGQTTTLGRGGSDYSAAILAYAIEAQCCHIYTDVAGVYTMDPNIVKTARRIPEMSFAEMAEFANFGSKVLHPATILPCLQSNIPIYIASTFNPEAGGTMILPQIETPESLVRAIALRKKQILITIRSFNMLNVYGFLAHVFEILARYKVSIDVISTSEVSVALTVDGTNLGSLGVNPFNNPELLKELQPIADITIEEGFTLVTLIGTNIGKEPGMIQRILSTINDYGLRLICHGASSSNVCFLVADDDAFDVVHKLHDNLITI